MIVMSYESDDVINPWIIGIALFSYKFN